MSKYDKEREAIGIKPVASSMSSTGKSKYDDERNTSKRAAENKQYADAMKAAYESNPEAFKPVNPEPLKNEKFHIPALDYINDKIGGVVEGISNFGNRAAVSAMDALTLGQGKKRVQQDQGVVGDIFRDNASAANTKTEHAADIVGNLYGFTAPAMGAYATGGKLATMGLAKIAPNAPKLVQTLARGVGAGEAYGLAREGLDAAVGDQNKSLADRALGVATDAALFGVGDAALSALGSGLKVVAQKYVGSKLGDAIGRFFKNGHSTQPQAGQLALPPGRGEQRLNSAMERSNLSPNESPIAGTGRLAEPLGLPEPNLLPPTRARAETRPNEYTRKLENLFKTANQQNFTPGRELEELESLWSQMAGPNDPKLDNLIDLAYPKQTPKVTQGSLNRARELQQSREAAGVPNLARSQSERYQPFTGNAGLPRERVGLADAQQQVEVTPPKRNFAPSEPVQSRPADASHLKVPSYVRDTIAQNNALAEKLGIANHIEELSAQGLTRKQVVEKVASKVPQGTDINQLVTSVKAFREIPSMDDRIEFATWLKNRNNPQLNPTIAQPQPRIYQAQPTQQPKVELPKPTGQQPRQFAETLKASDKTPQGFVERLKAAYTPTTNEQTLSNANKRIDKDIEEATSYAMGNSRFTAEKATVAQRLIDHYNQQGNYQRAVDIAEKVSEEATRAGQSIQALSMFNRLSAEGVLVYAQRLARKANESIPVGMKEVKVTEDMAAKLTNLTQVTQKMTGVKDLSNDVMNILEKAKSGEKLSETESEALKRFVNESKQFVQETTRKPKPPRPPQQPKDKRVRDNVISFLEAQEQAAKERLRARGIRVSSTPLDIWADYAVIGASKMAKGTIKFADWSEQMIKDLGEDIRPHLEQLYERAAGAFEISAKKVSSQTIDRAEKLTEKVIQGKKLEGSEADSLRSLAKKVSSLSGEEKRLASQDLQMILQGLDNPSVLKKIATTQTIGQLLNPKTQVRNALGNELFYRIERLNKVFSTPIDIARSKITGGDRTVTFRTNNQGEYWSNWMKGLKAGWKGANVNGLETQYDLGSPTFKSKYNPLTYMEKTLGAALKSFDTAAYMRAFNNTLGEQATLRAINEGKAGNKELIEKYIREADDNVLKIANEYGKYVTFQDNNIASKGLVALKKGLNFNKEFGIGDLILKYPKTPGAILMRALEYSPAGFLRSAAILARPIFKKEPNTAEVTQALSRAMIGTFGLSGLGYFLMDKGVVTGSASKDRDVRDLQRSAGQGQYQVNLSALFRLVKSNFNQDEAKLREGDTLYTYDWMQPVSVAASLGANVNKNMNDGNSKLSGLAGTAYNSLEGGLSTITEQSVLSGLKRAVEGYPGQSITDKITDILSDVPASFVPTAANQIKQLTDNARRETYSPNKLDQSLNKAQARIPGLAGKLPQQYDTLGNPKETYQNNSAANVLLNPGFSSTYKLSPEAKLIVDLINESGAESLAPRVPSKSITVNGEKVQLTGDQFSRYQQLQGEETRSQLVKKYDPSKSLDLRVKKVEDILRDSGTAARDKLKKEISK